MRTGRGSPPGSPPGTRARARARTRHLVTAPVGVLALLMASMAAGGAPVAQAAALQCSVDHTTNDGEHA